MTNLAYGQIVFSPRHDHFMKAKYLYKRGFYKKSMPLIASSSTYSVVGRPPLPDEFKAHIEGYIAGKPPHIAKMYRKILGGKQG